MKDQIRMIILSDHKSLRDEISHYLRSEAHLTVVAYPAQWNIQDMVKQINPTHILVSIPTDIPTDLKTQITNLANRCTIQIIAIVHQQEPKELADLLLAGINGFISVSDWKSHLMQSLEIMSHGGIALPPSLVRKVFDFLRNPIVAEKSRHLTNKEIQVLKEVRRGLSYKELADHFDIGECTIRTHCKSIYRKLGVRGRIEAINTVFLNPGIQNSSVKIS